MMSSPIVVVALGRACRGYLAASYTRPLSRLLYLLGGLAFAPLQAQLYYDADTVTTPAQDGSGAGWNTSNQNWWNGSANVAWPNLNSSVAVFGVNSGAAGTVNVGTVTANGIIFNAAGAGSYTLSGGTITLAGSSPTITTHADAQIDSILASSVGLIKAGNGKLTLNGVNTISGGVNIQAGEVVARISLGQSALGSSDINISTEAALTYNNVSTSGNLNVNNTLTGSGSLKLLFAEGGSARATRFNTTALNGFTGQVILSLATGASQTGDKLASVDSTTPSYLIDTNASLVINPGTQLFVTGNTNATTRFGGGITVSGTGNMEERGAIRLSRILLANITLAGDATFGTEGGTLNGSITGTATAGNTQTLTLGTTNSTGGLTMSGAIGDGVSGGKVALIKNQVGSVILSAVNTFTGGITVNAGAITLSAPGQSANSAEGAGGGAIVVNAGGTLNVSGDYNLGYARLITVDGGTLHFTNNNYANNVTLSNGAQVTSSASVFRLGFQSNPSITVTGTSSSTISAVMRLATSGGATPVVNRLTFNIADVNSGATADLFVSGQIVDVGTGNAGMEVFKTGSGTLSLSHINNTFTGPTTVNGGYLALSGNGTTGLGAVTIQNTATLLGTGIVRGNSFVAQNGATIHAGNGVTHSDFGTLRFTPTTGSGNFTFESGSLVILGLNPGGAGDRLNLDGLSNGSLAFNGNLEVTAPGYVPTSVETFHLLDWANLTCVTFASHYNAASYSGYLLGNGDDNLGLDLPDISTSGYAWDISSLIVNGTISTVMIVPEPSRICLTALGCLTLICRRNRSSRGMA